MRERRGAGLPVLFTSGYAGETFARDDASPALRLLPKPYTLERLASAVRHAIDGV